MCDTDFHITEPSRLSNKCLTTLSNTCHCGRSVAYIQKYAQILKHCQCDEPVNMQTAHLLLNAGTPNALSSPQTTRADTPCSPIIIITESNTHRNLSEKPSGQPLLPLPNIIHASNTYVRVRLPFNQNRCLSTHI